jgi:hypothetical protein
MARPPIPHPSVLNSAVADNAAKPEQVAEVNKVYNELSCYQPGAGVIDVAMQYGDGISLYA